MRPAAFRGENYRNIEDSGWVELERVTALVGWNESGKTTLLKALHKFNPATKEPFDGQRDFPRDRCASRWWLDAAGLRSEARLRSTFQVVGPFARAIRARHRAMRGSPARSRAPFERAECRG